MLTSLNDEVSHCQKLLIFEKSDYTARQVSEVGGFHFLKQVLIFFKTYTNLSEPGKLPCSVSNP